MSKPDLAVTRSPMGGGWAWALTDAGARALLAFFNDQPAPIPVMIQENAQARGYTIEPYQMADLADCLKQARIEWEVH